MLLKPTWELPRLGASSFGVLTWRILVGLNYCFGSILGIPDCWKLPRQELHVRMSEDAKYLHVQEHGRFSSILGSVVAVRSVGSRA